jgi:hypothetical protein
MLSEDVKVLFSGFEPTSDMKSSLYFVLNRMHLKSPSQSFLSATFTLTNGLFEGVIKVTSSAEDFVVKATDVNLPHLGQKLMEKLGDSLEKWKAIRFK